MSNNKDKKRVYSKPKVEEPVEKIVEKEVISVELTKAPEIEPIEEVKECPESTSEVAEESNDIGHVPTGVAAEEQPEYIKIEEQPDTIVLEAHIDGEKLAETLNTIAETVEAHQNVDAVEEFRKKVQAELEKPLGVDAEEELTKQLAASSIAEDKKTEQLSLETIKEEAEKIIEEHFGEGAVDALKKFAEADVNKEHISTPEEVQEFLEKFHNNKTSAIEPPKQKSLESLSNAELRHFRRTGQMPR